LKKWSRQKEELAFRKELLHSQNEKIKGEKEEKMKREKQDEVEFKNVQWSARKDTPRRGRRVPHQNICTFHQTHSAESQQITFIRKQLTI
jgi:hypothetical protein